MLVQKGNVKKKFEEMKKTRQTKIFFEKGMVNN